MPLDRPRTDEKLGADLGVCLAVRGQVGDLRLLRGELVARLDRPSTRRLAGGEQLTTGALAEPRGADTSERSEGSVELLAGVDAAARATQPLAVEKLRAGELERAPAPSEPVERLAEKRVAVLAIAEQRRREGPDPELTLRDDGGARSTRRRRAAAATS